MRGPYTYEPPAQAEDGSWPTPGVYDAGRYIAAYLFPSPFGEPSESTKESSARLGEWLASRLNFAEDVIQTLERSRIAVSTLIDVSAAIGADTNFHPLLMELDRMIAEAKKVNS